jgi:hypothetical protein
MSSLWGNAGTRIFGDVEQSYALPVVEGDKVVSAWIIIALDLTQQVMIIAGHGITIYLRCGILKTYTPFADYLPC